MYHPDFRTLGSTSYRIEVWNGNVGPAIFNVPATPQPQIDARTPMLGVGFLGGDEANFVVRHVASTLFLINGQPAVGDELVVYSRVLGVSDRADLKVKGVSLPAAAEMAVVGLTKARRFGLDCKPPWAPSLNIDAPHFARLGVNRFSILVEGVPAGATAAYILGPIPNPTPLVFPMPTGCTFYPWFVPGVGFIFFDTAPSRGGTVTFNIPIPSQSHLANALLFFQGMALDLNRTPSFGTTAGLAVRIGANPGSCR